MHGFLSTLGWGFTVLVFVSVLVALLEYIREVNRPQALPTLLPQRAAHVDVDLATLLPAGDQGQRQATLDETLARMAKPAVDPAWISTSPMVLVPHGKAGETATG